LENTGQKTKTLTQTIHIGLLTQPRTSKQRKTQQKYPCPWFSRLLRQSARKRGGLILR